MRFPAIVPVLLAAGAFLSGCDRSVPAPTAALPQVTAAVPLVRPITDWDAYIGRFEAVERVEVRPRVSGYVVETHFEEGQTVERGQLLFTIDARPFEAALDEVGSRVAAVRARLRNARAELERARGLVEVRAVSQEELEQLEAAVRTAEADLAGARAAERSAQLDLEFTRVLSPIDGRVSYRRVDPGNAVRADETLLTVIVSIDPIHFVFEGSEALYLKYRRAGGADERRVRIRLQDEQDYAWTGALDFLDNALDAGTGTIRGRALVPNPDGFLTPGMFGRMQLQASGEYSGLLLPDSAVVTRGADRIVYVVDADGLVTAKLVELGPLHEGLRVIRSGLAGADRVVVDGQQRVRPGQSVDVLAARIEAPGPDGAPVAIVPVESEASGATADSTPALDGASTGGATTADTNAVGMTAADPR